MRTRVQPRLFGGSVTTYPGGRRGFQPELAGLREAERQLDADAIRAWLERVRAGEPPELDDVPELEG